MWFTRLRCTVKELVGHVFSSSSFSRSEQTRTFDNARHLLLFSEVIASIWPVDNCRQWKGTFCAKHGRLVFSSSSSNHGRRAVCKDSLLLLQRMQQSASANNNQRAGRSGRRLRHTEAALASIFGKRTNRRTGSIRNEMVVIIV